MKTRRIHPARCRDVKRLSEMLDTVLSYLEREPFCVTRRALSYNTGIPEDIWCKLCALHRSPDGVIDVLPEDYAIAFANLLFRYPTVKLWQTQKGQILVEC